MYLGYYWNFQINNLFLINFGSAFHIMLLIQSLKLNFIVLVILGERVKCSTEFISTKPGFLLLY